MIIIQPQNTPSAAPQFTDMVNALAKYRVFRGEPLISMTDFVKWLVMPSSDRVEFLALFTASVHVWNNNYVKQIYS